jgi:hypothetical protein
MADAGEPEAIFLNSPAFLNVDERLLIRFFETNFYRAF